MQKFNVIMATSARNDLYDIANYLCRFSPAIAENYYRLILQKTNSLETFPTACPLVRNEGLRKKGYRWINARNYMIYFIVHEEINLVVIERILHSRRAYDALSQSSRV